MESESQARHKLHRALGEVGRLSRVIEDAFERGDLRMNDFEEDPLASSPLAKLAGEVLGATFEEREAEKRLYSLYATRNDAAILSSAQELGRQKVEAIRARREAVDALQAELGREGGE